MKGWDGMGWDGLGYGFRPDGQNKAGQTQQETSQRMVCGSIRLHEILCIRYEMIEKIVHTSSHDNGCVEDKINSKEGL